MIIVNFSNEMEFDGISPDILREVLKDVIMAELFLTGECSLGDVYSGEVEIGRRNNNKYNDWMTEYQQRLSTTHDYLYNVLDVDQLLISDYLKSKGQGNSQYESLVRATLECFISSITPYLFELSMPIITFSIVDVCNRVENLLITIE
jgi:hypothetical protein